MKKNLSFPGQDSFVVTKKGNKKYSAFTGGIMPSAPTDTKDDGTLSPPAQTVLPVFPDFSIMDCVQLQYALNGLNETLVAPSFIAKDKDWVAAYENAIAYVRSLQMSKGCQTKHTPIPPADNPPTGGGGTTVPPKTVGGISLQIPGANAGTGMMAGASPAPTTPGKPAAKKSFPWFWVILGGAVVWYALSKK